MNEKEKVVKGYGATDGEVIKRFNVFMPEGLHRSLKSAAAVSGVTMNDLVVSLVKAHVGGQP